MRRIEWSSAHPRLAVLVLLAIHGLALGQPAREPDGHVTFEGPDRFSFLLNITLEQWVRTPGGNDYQQRDNPATYRLLELVCNRPGLIGPEDHCQLVDGYMALPAGVQEFAGAFTGDELYDTMGANLVIRRMEIGEEGGEIEISTTGGGPSLLRLRVEFEGSDLYVRDALATGGPASVPWELRLPSRDYDVPLPPLKLRAPNLDR